MGAPYLWGGRSPAGMDCSGFVQQVMAERGMALPRDAEDQIRVSRPIRPSESARLGDLVCFGAPGRRGAHIGIYLGGGYFAHARGRVALGSLDPDNQLCDNELTDQYRGICRPPSKWRPGG